MWHLEYIPEGKNHWFVAELSKEILKPFGRGDQHLAKSAAIRLLGQIDPAAHNRRLVWREEVQF